VKVTIGGWGTWIAGIAERQFEAQGIPSLQWGFGTEFFKYIVFGDAGWDYRQYDFSTWEKDTRFVSKFMNATNPDLSTFRDLGGKLILWHGWSDAALTALASIGYFEEAEALDPAVRSYFRLFMLPGVMHCSAGPALTAWIGTLQSWTGSNAAWHRHRWSPPSVTRRGRQS